MGGNGVAFLDHDSNHAAGHGGLQGSGTCGTRLTTAGTERAGVVDAVGDTFCTDVERGIGGIRFEDDAVRLARDEHGEDAGAHEMGIGFDGLAVDPNAPLSGNVRGVDFDLRGTPADFEVEHHRTAVYQSENPTASRRAAVFHARAGPLPFSPAPLDPGFVASKRAAATAGIAAWPLDAMACGDGATRRRSR